MIMNDYLVHASRDPESYRGDMVFEFHDPLSHRVRPMMEHRTPFRWQLALVPGVAHDGISMLEHYLKTTRSTHANVRSDATLGAPVLKRAPPAECRGSRWSSLFLEVYMELGSYFLLLQEQIKDIIITARVQTWT